jgi:hypothetical protein
MDHPWGVWCTSQGTWALMRGSPVILLDESLARKYADKWSAGVTPAPYEAREHLPVVPLPQRQLTYEMLEGFLAEFMNHSKCRCLDGPVASDGRLAKRCTFCRVQDAMAFFTGVRVRYPCAEDEGAP